MISSQVFGDALDERRRHDEKWGEQTHTQMEWLAILMEEVGEYTQEILRNHFGKRDNLPTLYAELTQVVAVESMRRNELS